MARKRNGDGEVVFSVTDWYAGKQHCVGCGLHRDVEYAKTNPCVCCGSLGTQRTMPAIDEDGYRLDTPTTETETEEVAIPDLDALVEDASRYIDDLFIDAAV